MPDILFTRCVARNGGDGKVDLGEAFAFFAGSFASTLVGCRLFAYPHGLCHCVDVQPVVLNLCFLRAKGT